MGADPALQLPAHRRKSQMIEPVLLLLLLQREGAYGYELQEDARELALTETEIDRSALYRCLRWLEEQGQVASEWDTGGEGAPRRRYRLTALGIKSLTLWADMLKQRRGALDVYLERYRKVIARARRSRRI